MIWHDHHHYHMRSELRICECKTVKGVHVLNSVQRHEDGGRSGGNAPFTLLPRHQMQVAGQPPFRPIVPGSHQDMKSGEPRAGLDAVSKKMFWSCWESNYCYPAHSLTELSRILFMNSKVSISITSFNFYPEYRQYLYQNACLFTFRNVFELYCVYITRNT